MGAAGVATCAEAQAVLIQAQQQLGQATAARNAQRDKVDRERRRRNVAAAALTTALAAIGAALPWNPIAALAAATAAVAAGAVLVAMAGRLAVAQAALVGLDAAVSALQSAVNTAQDLVDRLCPAGHPPPGSGPPLLEPGNPDFGSTPVRT